MKLRECRWFRTSRVTTSCTQPTVLNPQSSRSVLTCSSHLRMLLPYWSRQMCWFSTYRSDAESMWFNPIEKKGLPSGVINHQRPFRLLSVKNLSVPSLALSVGARSALAGLVVDERRTAAATPEERTMN